jgi:quinol-cytochrome oxidoreductase complex cytochrome b subunit/Fe-S-cluster-containing hydrogenase component 2
MTTKNTPPPTGTEHWVPRHWWWTRALERAALWLERPLNRFNHTAQLNPFYHTGTIAVYLLLVVAATGFYLFIFTQYGYELSYNSVAKLEGQPIGRFIRALHRYASGALVVTTFFHALRMLFMERFRGPRWLAWVTGHLMLGLMWAAGVTGYWLVWDGRAQLITRRFIAGLPSSWGNRFQGWLVRLETAESWQFFFLLLIIHVLLFLITALFFWVHIKRLSRPKWFPDTPWLVGMSAVLVLGSALFPAGLAARADHLQLPDFVTLDPIFLFYLPAQGWTAWLVWGVLLSVGVGLAILPWWPQGSHPELPRVQVLDEKCTGCTRCALDCPYDAIHMVDLPEGSEHKYLAVANPDLCVSCGICLGSCTDMAITLGDTPPEALWTAVHQRLLFAKARTDGPADIELVFTCERYANQTALPYLERRVDGVVATHGLIEVIAVPCAGTIPPDVLTYALEQGAAEVRVVGCPPDDCANREGNLWAEQRLTRERPPRLKRAYANVPISAVWLPPNEFETALAADIKAEESNWLESRRIFNALTWQNFLPAFAMLGLVLLLQILTNDLPWRPPIAQTAYVQGVVADVGAPLLRLSPYLPLYPQTGAYVVQLAVDGQVVGEETYPAETVLAEPTFFFVERPLALGEYDLALMLTHPATGGVWPLAGQTAELVAGQIGRLADGGEPRPPTCLAPVCR